MNKLREKEKIIQEQANLIKEKEKAAEMFEEKECWIYSNFPWKIFDLGSFMDDIYNRTDPEDVIIFQVGKESSNIAYFQ